MGVPRFFRWLCERWPCAYETVKNGQLPPTDNLFVDLGGVLQAAASQAGGQGDTEAIIKAAQDYIDKLVGLVRPEKLVFLALNGVGPRAKLNQERGNMFRIAENMKLAKAAASRRGETLRAFDMNAISPGTDFITNVTSSLKFYVRRKISESATWQGPKIVLSGADVPGEASYKILDYIRSMKLSGNWTVPQRHCVYGLDPSLVMMGLATQEPHMYMLRELVSYGKGSKGPAARELLESTLQDEFILCRLGLVRDYLELELKAALPAPLKMDVDRVVEDFILLCVLAGNDYLPGLPTLDTTEVLGRVMDAYKQLMPVMGGYMIESGNINAFRLEKLLQKVASMEADALAHRVEEAEFFETRQTRDTSEMAFVSDELAPIFMHRAAREIFEASTSTEEALGKWKDRHYVEKLEVVGDIGKRGVVEDYYRALCWTMHYYLTGIKSWSWSYSHHYAPLPSDMKRLKTVRVVFQPGDAYSPFAQLMATLPKFSYKLLPEVLQPFMDDPDSPLADFYPDEVHMDMEGKRAEWEAVVLLPLLDARRLVQVVSSIPSNEYMDEEMERNKVGHALSFSYNEGLIRVHLCMNDPASMETDTEKGGSSMGSSFGSIGSGWEGSLKNAIKSGTKFNPMAKGRNSVELPAGFPTLKSLKAKAQLEKVGVKLFTYPSEKESLLLSVASNLGRGEVDTTKVSKSMLGRHVYIDWPYLKKAKVMKIEDRESVVCVDKERRTKTEQEINEWNEQVQGVLSDIRKNKALDVDECRILVTVKPIEGWLRTGDGKAEERFGQSQTWPLQLVVRHTPYPTLSPERPESGRFRFKCSDRLLYLGKLYRGCIATVDDDQPSGEGDSHGISVSIQPHSPASVLAWKSVQKLMRTSTEEYHPSGAIAQRLGVSPQGLSRITGSLWVNTGTVREEVGLAVKLGSKNMCVPGYVRPSPNGTGWEYTDALVSILETYKRSFFWVFKAVDATPEGGEIHLPTVFPYLEANDVGDLLAKTKEWLASLPLAGRPLVQAEARVGSVQAIKRGQAILRLTSRTPRPVVQTVQREELVAQIEDSKLLSTHVGGTFEIGEQVSYVGSARVPFGEPGVVVGVMPDGVEVLFAHEILDSTSIFGKATGHSSCLLQPWELVNISAIMGDRTAPPVPEKREETMHRRWPTQISTNAQFGLAAKASLSDMWSDMEMGTTRIIPVMNELVGGMEYGSNVIPTKNRKNKRSGRSRHSRQFSRQGSGYRASRDMSRDAMELGRKECYQSYGHMRRDSVASSIDYAGGLRSYGSGVYIPGMAATSPPESYCSVPYDMNMHHRHHTAAGAQATAAYALFNSGYRRY